MLRLVFLIFLDRFKENFKKLPKSKNWIMLKFAFMKLCNIFIFKKDKKKDEKR